MNSAPPRTGNFGGFTLLEVLVVLLLTSMLTGILLQGLQQVFRIQAHFGAETFNSQHRAMQSAWFRQTVNGLAPDHANGGNRFRGGQREFSGLTLAALDAPDAALVPFTWRLQFNSERGETLLQYGADESGPVLMSWSEDSGRFAYVDASGGDHDAWPPFLGEWPQLPNAIRLETQQAGDSKIVIAVPKGPATARMRQKDPESE